MNDRQGRDSLASLNASRRAIGLREVTQWEWEQSRIPDSSDMAIPLPLKVLCALAAVLCLAIVSGAMDAMIR